jgi:hypothetical protein
MDPIVALNYDTVTSTNSGIVTGGFSTSDLAESYYVSAKPSYFQSCPWPPYSPLNVAAKDISPTNIPAGFRYVYNTEPPAGSGGGGGPTGAPSTKAKRGGGRHHN